MNHGPPPGLSPVPTPPPARTNNLYLKHSPARSTRVGSSEGIVLDAGCWFHLGGGGGVGYSVIQVCVGGWFIKVVEASKNEKLSNIKAVTKKEIAGNKFLNDRLVIKFSLKSIKYLMWVEIRISIK